MTETISRAAAVVVYTATESTPTTLSLSLSFIEAAAEALASKREGSAEVAYSEAP